MFSTEQRDRLRSDLLNYAAVDSRISGSAITGSAAAGREDKWSDIDLAFGVTEALQLPAVLSEWTTLMYRQHHAVHHMDVLAGPWIYRVFLLPDTLQVDLAFVPAEEFRALSPTFRLVSGKANPPGNFPSPQPADLIGFAWLYALHARTCIARNQVWQAEYMISGVRDHALALACLRHNLPAVHGRGMDLLPKEITTPLEDALVRHLDTAELARAFAAATQALLSEIRSHDQELADRLRVPLTQIVATVL